MKRKVIKYIIEEEEEEMWLYDMTILNDLAII